jgi:hypothetical protein
MDYTQIMLALGKGRKVDIEKKLNELKNNMNNKYNNNVEDAPKDENIKEQKFTSSKLKKAKGSLYH